MTNRSISISDNRVTVELMNGNVAQFVVWNLELSQHENLKSQLNTAFAICSNFKEIEEHLTVNGFDASLEDIYTL